MRQIALTSALVAVLCFAAGAQAWWCTGHMVIAEIARQNLDSGIESQVNAQFQYLNQFFSQTNDMISGACWADDLKSHQLRAMEGWHFINQPYDPTNFPIARYPIQDENVETLIMQLGETVKKETENQWILAFATANLVHFYGDIHQPLHATELFSSVYPTGDKGGNLLKVNVPWDSNPFALHFVWDSVCGQYLNAPNRPLSHSDYEYIKGLANGYIANFTVPDAEKKVWNSTIYALESLEYAIKYAYDNNQIQAGDNITQSYLDTCMQISGYRIAYAGYRLASELNYLFKDQSKISGAAMLKRIAEGKKDFKAAIKNAARP